jgi:5-methylcytosine-specific restriction endonuclease McrA
VPRSTDEWFARHKDGTYNHKSEVPPKVKLRVKSRANDCCQNCGVRVRQGGGHVDHIEALIFSTDNRPLNRESNLQYLCTNCHKPKTADDVAKKSREAKTQASLAGFKNTRKPFYVPKPKPEPTQRTWYYDERGRLCASYLKPVQPTTDDN